jgi:hypothetical protein
MQVLIGDRLRQQRLNSYNALRDGRHGWCGRG